MPHDSVNSTAHCLKNHSSNAHLFAGFVKNTICAALLLDTTSAILLEKQQGFNKKKNSVSLLLIQ